MSQTKPASEKAPPFQAVIRVELGDDASQWSSVGAAFYNRPTDEHPASLTLKLDAAPADGDVPHRLRSRKAYLYPSNGAVSVDFEDGQRLRMLTVQKREKNGEATSYRQYVGTAFYNAGSDDRREGFAMLFDAIPLDRTIYLQPPRDTADDKADEDLPF